MRKLSELIETFFNFWRNFGWFPWRKIREATEGRGTVLKLENVVWGEFVKTPWVSPFVTVIRKLLNTFRSIDFAYLSRFCHETAKIHSLCIIWSNSEECKKWYIVIPIQTGIRQRLNDRYQINSPKLEPILYHPNWTLAEKSIACG